MEFFLWPCECSEVPNGSMYCLHGFWGCSVLCACFPGRKLRPGIWKRKSLFLPKAYLKSQGGVKMYKEFSYKMLLFWVPRKSCLSSSKLAGERGPDSLNWGFLNLVEVGFHLQPWEKLYLPNHLLVNVLLSPACLPRSLRETVPNHVEPQFWFTLCGLQASSLLDSTHMFFLCHEMKNK